MKKPESERTTENGGDNENSDNQVNMAVLTSPAADDDLDGEAGEAGEVEVPEDNEEYKDQDDDDTIDEEHIRMANMAISSEAYDVDIHHMDDQEFSRIVSMIDGSDLLLDVQSEDADPTIRT